MGQYQWSLLRGHRCSSESGNHGRFPYQRILRQSGSRLFRAGHQFRAVYCRDFLTMLDLGIYPLGQANTLRSQYIEVFHANAAAFPEDILTAHLALLPPSISPTPGLKLRARACRSRRDGQRPVRFRQLHQPGAGRCPYAARCDVRTSASPGHQQRYSCRVVHCAVRPPLSLLLRLQWWTLCRRRPRQRPLNRKHDALPRPDYPRRSPAKSSCSTPTVSHLPHSRFRVAIPCSREFW